MRLKITQYGYPNDSTPDTLTEEGIGAWEDKLNGGGCALTDSARTLLGEEWGSTLPHNAKLKIVFDNGVELIRFWEDRAPETEPRLDLYNPVRFDPRLRDFAEVTVIPDDGSTTPFPL